VITSRLRTGSFQSMLMKRLRAAHAGPFPQLPFYKVRQPLKNLIHQRNRSFLSKWLIHFSEYRAAISS